MRSKRFAALFLTLALAPFAAVAQESPSTAPPAAMASAVRTAPAERSKPDADAVTHHEIAAGDHHLSYRATAGTLALTDAKGEVSAHVFYVAYVLDGAAKPRALTFVFNGGPGAASAFLQLAAAGPRVVPFNEAGSAAVQPAHLIDNPDTWLDFTDLVFIDPVATGFSRATGGDDQAREKFFGVEKDADSMLAFVQLYLARTGRSLDPVFLAGESYGGFRAALLAKQMLLAGLDVRGTVLISPALEFSLIWGDDLLLLPQALALPSIAFSHAGLMGSTDDPQKLRQEVEAFARGPYLTHLAAGQHDDPAIDAALARYTGLPAADIARANGRVSVRDFTDAYRRSHDRVLSSYDGSVSGAVPRPSDPHNADPILSYAVSVLQPAFVTYAASELNYTTDLPYTLLNRSAAERWDYGGNGAHQGYAGALDELEEARTQRPWLHVLIAAGYTDLVTPYATDLFMADQMRPIDGAVPVDVHVYQGGHMMYLRSASRRALSADVRSLFAAAMH